MVPINPQRLVQTFETLAKCDRVSRVERRFATLLMQHLEDWGVVTRFELSSGGFSEAPDK